MDQTCNDDPMVSAYEGHCGTNGTCSCSGMYRLNTVTGRCFFPSGTCTKAGDFAPCGSPFTQAATGMCDLTNTCFCFTGFQYDPGTRRCVMATPPCTLGTNGTCNDNPGMSALAGNCVVMASGVGCDCSDGLDTNPATGKCRGAGVTSGVVAYSLASLPTGLQRLRIQREDTLAGHCALLTLVGGATVPPGNIIVTTQGGPPTWEVESVRYAVSSCANADSAGTTRFDAAYAEGNVTITNGVTTTATINVNVLFVTGPSGTPPATMRFLAKNLQL